jgi:hypothetical protein
MIGDWIYENLGWCIAGLFVAVFGVLILAMMADSKESARLMRQCMDDGKKEYECKAMLKQDLVPIPMPIMPR